jgi:nicotinate-nucleotide adenylyltransferase
VKRVERRSAIGAPNPWGDARRTRIGLLGGSFNPAHAGHAHVARRALAALALDQVWLMVSPGNPLKPALGMAPLADRLASAKAIAAPPRGIATDIERSLGTRFTADTLAALRRRFRNARFVLLLGADNLAQLPRWHRWRALARDTPIAILPRPGHSRAALHGQAAAVLARYRRRPRALLAGAAAGHAGWCLIPSREVALSATAIRNARRDGAEQRVAA